MATQIFDITTSIVNIMIDGILTKVEAYNGTVPGPTFEFDLDDDIIIRLINDLPYPTGIHWHGIELQNSADGTPVTQDGIPGGDLQILAGGVTPVGGTYLYKFKVTRPGIFWYHPHHHHSTNRVFRGLYGMIIVKDPDETTLVSGPGGIPSNTLPTELETKQIVLSDITICRPSNPIVTYPDPSMIADPLDRAEWLDPGVTVQTGPSPRDLCELAPLNDEGGPRLTAGLVIDPFLPGEVPNVQVTPPIPGQRTVEGQTVLTNGQSVGGRLGTPLSAPPRDLIGTPITINVESNRGVRLQIVNCAFVRYFRLRLVDSTGTIIPLLRVGGEAGLLDEVVEEGGMKGTLNMQYDEGEILLPPATRVDVVAVIPAGEVIGNILTMWTRDFPRIGGGGGWSQIPSVPVMHFMVTGAGTAYSLSVGDALRAKAGFPGSMVTALASTTTPLVTPTGGFVAPKLGMASRDIKLTAAAGAAGIDSVFGTFSGVPSYYNVPHLGSTRYTKLNDILELEVTNMTGADHPFHLHGFSFQPVSLKPRVGGAPGGERNWLYNEYLDTLNVPNSYTLKFRVHILDRKLQDGFLNGGAFGRWLFHCHIFFHAHSGMISELVVGEADGTETPNVDVGGSWAYASSGENAQRFGTYNHPDGLPIVLSTSLGSVTDLGSGKYQWDSGLVPDQTTYVYVTATDTTNLRQDQTVFRLQIGGLDNGSDNGDPHIRTVDGTSYDFQSVGEFTLLADRDGMEVQTRQTPVPTATPITNSYTGLTSCVSVNTAVAARVGSHYISYQPDEKKGTLAFYINGKRTELTTRTLNLDNNLVRGIDIDGKMTLRVDYAHHAVLIVTPHFWSNNNIHYMNISLSHTHGDEGLMGKVPSGSWLPRLRSGATLGSKPQGLTERYVELYQTFADSWRVTDRTSLFTYASGTSTVTFTDKDWPTITPPCKLKPQFELPGAIPQPGISEADAKIICKDVTESDLFENCVLDVAATGEKSFADGYLLEQKIRLNATSIHLTCFPDQTGEKIKIAAIVVPLDDNSEKPKGNVTFYVNGTPVGEPIAVNSNGQAHITITRPNPDDKVTAEYDDDKEGDLASCSSPNLICHNNVKHVKPTIKDDSLAKRWYFWLILIIIILIIIGLIIF